MECEARFGLTENSGKWPCRVFTNGVGSKSIQCSQWMHGRCSGVPGKLQNVAALQCKRCDYRQPFRGVMAVQEIMISSLDKLQCIAMFCYL